MTYSHPPRILVVDDYLEGARVLAQLLQIFGFETFLAHTGETAVARAVDLAPDAIVLDLILPDIDGYEVARRIRAHAATRDKLLVALTGYSMDDTRHQAADSPFDHHLVKPVAPSLLRDLLWDAFAGSTASAG